MILVGVDGSPKDIKVDKSSGYLELDRAAMEAARRWRFNPTIRNGQKVEGYARVPVNFNIINPAVISHGRLQLQFTLDFPRVALCSYRLLQQPMLHRPWVAIPTPKP